MLIAVPSDAPGGLDAAVSEHFGHCEQFTLIEVGDDGAVGEVSTVANVAHSEGGCMAPVQLLKGHGVDVLVAGGMGARPLSGFQQVGITVYFKEDAETVQGALDRFLADECREFGPAETCGGGCDHEHHHHEPAVQTEPITDGPADIRDGRFVTLSYVLKGTDGGIIDSSERTGPMRYIHGNSQIIPALEQAVAGLERGAQKIIEIPYADAFGERDEARVVEVAREQLPDEVQEGMVVAGQNEQGERFPLRVIYLDDSIGRLDANHPLAGVDLVFEVKVEDVEAVQQS